MRRVVIVPSFDREAEAIGIAIEERFGEEARRKFVADLARLCTLIAHLPKIGRSHHGYNTKLLGFVSGQNWLFFDFDDEKVEFLHIVNAKRNKGRLSF